MRRSVPGTGPKRGLARNGRSGAWAARGPTGARGAAAPPGVRAPGARIAIAARCTPGAGTGDVTGSGIGQTHAQPLAAHDNL